MRPHLTTEEIRDLLVPTHLYYDVGAQSLRTRALGEILTKILFLKERKKAKFAELSGETARIVGVPNVADHDIQAGLEFLRTQGVVIKQGKAWLLAEDGFKRVERDLDNARDRIDHILDKHFGTRFERPTLTKWFKAAAALFFGEYGEIWAHRLKRQPSSLPSMHSVSEKLRGTITQFGMQEEAAALVQGFQSFLRDYADPMVDQQIWSFAQAMLAAKLVSATVGPDPLSISEFKNAKLLLDTNVLFLAALEKSRFSNALGALAACLKDIGTTLHIIYETKKEYEGVVARKRTETLRVVDNYPLAVVADVNDLFIKTALARGCKNLESFATFFGSIQDSPKSIEDQAIRLEDDPQIAKAAELGAKDSKKQNEISAEWLKYHSYKKPKNSVLHDSSLDSVVDLLRKEGDKAWIITVDRSMQAFSAKWNGKELPAWVGLDTLIQVLAVSGSGPSHKPENFAPLLSTLIREDIQPSDRAFSLEDLDALLDLEERVRELSKEEIEEFAVKMARLRLGGKPKTDSELQLEIRRTFQRKKIASDEQTRVLETEVQTVREDLRRESDLKQAAASALTAQLEKSRKRREYILYTFKLVMVLVVGALIVGYGAFVWKNGSPNWGSLLVGIGITEVIISAFRWVVPGFKMATTNARKWAEKEVSRLIADAQKK